MLSVVVFGDKRKDSSVISGLLLPGLADEVKRLLEEATGRDVYVFDTLTPPGSVVSISYRAELTAQEIVHAWLQSGAECGHAWVAGLVYVDDEDLATVARDRQVSCQECGLTYVASLA